MAGKKEKTTIKKAVPWSLLSQAMEGACGEWKQYLDAAEMKVVEIPADPYLSDDPEGVRRLSEEIEEGWKERYWPLPDGRTIREFECMQAFAAGIDDAKAGSDLERALSGRGAFRRFKDALYRHGLEPRWYAYREKRFRKVAAEWCEDHGFTFWDDLAEGSRIASINVPGGREPDGRLPAEGIRKLVIRESYAACLEGEPWDETLFMTPTEIECEGVPQAGRERRALRWRYETRSEAFAAQFARAGEVLAELICGDPEEGYLDDADVEIWAEWEDGTKYHGLFLSARREFADLYGVVRKMIPPCEKMPWMLAALED